MSDAVTWLIVGLQVAMLVQLVEIRSLLADGIRAAEKEGDARPPKDP